MRPRIVFLGTSAAMPTPKSFLTSILIEGLKSNILVDVGEATQIRLNEIGFDPLKLNVVLITHLHGDHFLGLYPLLESMVLKARSQNMHRDLVIVAPSNLCRSLSQSFNSLPISINCIDSKDIVFPQTLSTSLGDALISAVPMNHGGIECYGYWIKLLINPRRDRYVRIFMGFDGICDQRCLDTIKVLGAEILVLESTYSDLDIHEATHSYHSTPSLSAKIAQTIGSRLLILTHISCRYSDRRILEDEARRYYSGSVYVVHDLDMIPIYRLKFY